VTFVPSHCTKYISGKKNTNSPKNQLRKEYFSLCKIFYSIKNIETNNYYKIPFVLYFYSMKLLLFLSSVILTVGCVENSADFLEPQPSGAKNLESFPKSLFGNYQNIVNNEKIIITDKLLIKSGAWEINASKHEIDTSSDFELLNDTLIDLKEKLKIPVIFRNDSVFGSMPWQDTVFVLSESSPLRKMKEFYILNNFTCDSIWKVARLEEVKNKGIVISIINSNKEIEALKRLTKLYEIELKNDTIVSYKLKPTQKEFKQMLNSKELFTDSEIYSIIH